MGKSSKMTEQAKRMSLILEGSNEFKLDFSSHHLANVSGEMKKSLNDDDHSMSSHGQSSTTSDRSPTVKGTRRTSAQRIAEKENRQVKYSKILVFFVLLAAAAAVGYLTYRYITGEEEDDYRTQVSFTWLCRYAKTLTQVESLTNSTLSNDSSKRMPKSSLMYPIQTVAISWLS